MTKSSGTGILSDRSIDVSRLKKLMPAVYRQPVKEPITDRLLLTTDC